MEDGGMSVFFVAHVTPSVRVSGICGAVVLLVVHVTPTGSGGFWWRGWRKCFLRVRVPAFDVLVNLHDVFFPRCWRGFRCCWRSRRRPCKCVWHCSCRDEGCWEHASPLHTFNP